jgi:hypothetical protein
MNRNHLHAALCAAALCSSPAFAQKAPASDCSFQMPAPLLQTQRLPGYTLARQRDNEMRETATLRDGVGLSVHQGGCADFVTIEYVFSVPARPGLPRDRDALIDLARREIGRINAGDSADRKTELDTFLQRAHSGANSACRDGSAAPPGDCSWESGGGFSLAIKQERGKRTRITVLRYISG